MSRWWRLIRERFPLGSALPMAVAFVLANAAVAGAAAGRSPEPPRVAAASLLALSFLFRLRLFDELKDHETDRVIHPERPLARGLVSRREVGAVAGGLVLAETSLAAMLGPGPLLVHGVAVLYSGLMLREFFVGRWLRPRLTTYAVAHTLVSALLGASIATAVVPRDPGALGSTVVVFGLANWSAFNVFEFARKTFAPSEERPRVASYSKVFGPAGAGGLVVTQIGAAVGALWLVGPEIVGRSVAAAESAVAALPAGAALLFGARPDGASARTLRLAAGAWVVVFFAVVAAALLRNGG